RVNVNYRRTRGVTWALRLDQQVPIRSASREWPSANLSWSFSPSATPLGRVLTSVSAQFGYRELQTSSEQPSFGGSDAAPATGQADCVAYVDSRQTQMQLSLDTDLPPTLSAGFQMAYLVNDERQANRKTSQLVITAFVELHTSVGQLQ